MKRIVSILILAYPILVFADKIYFKDDTSIEAQIILKIPKGSKKGEIKAKVRNQPAQTFVYQNGRVCVLDSLAPRNV